MLIRVLIFVLALCLISCNKQEGEPKLEIGQSILFGLEDHSIQGAFSKQYEKSLHSRTDTIASSGKYSNLVGGDNPYGVSCVLNNLNGGETYLFSADKYPNTGKGEVIGEINNEHLYTTPYKHEKLDNGWVRQTGFLIIPKRLKNASAKIYAMNLDAPVYFDNLKITRINPDSLLKTAFIPDTLELSINHQELKTIKGIRAIANQKGVLLSKDNFFVDGQLKINNQSNLDIEVRLKGDWTDHLIGNRWSFRIKLQDTFYKGMKTFSLQSPHTRGDLNEWFVHKLFNHEDVLTTKYDFVVLKLNAKSLGVYALEEHFVKQLLESNNRREAPIIKFDENEFWENAQKKPINTLAIEERAKIIAFQQKKTNRNNTLKQLFRTGVSNLDKLRYENVNLTDFEQMSAYYAIMDLTMSYHSNVWHNLRFYINPITQKLEPIAFDCHSDDNNSYDNTYLGDNSLDLYGTNDLSLTIKKKLFKEKQFVGLYQSKLIKLLSENTLEKVYSIQETKLRQLENFINQEYYNRFDINKYRERRKKLLNLFHPDKTQNVFTNSKKGVYNYYNLMSVAVKVGDKIILPNDMISSSKKISSFEIIGIDSLFKIVRNDSVKILKNHFNKVNFKHNPETIQAFNCKNKRYEVRNFSNQSIEILGRADSINANICLEGIILAPYTEFLQLQNYNRKIAGKGKYLHYKIIGEDSVRTTKIKKANGIGETTALEKVIKNGYKQLPLVKKGNDFILPKGNYEISNIQYISNANKLIIEAGTKITFLENGGFVSEIPVHFNGKQNDSIKISANHRENHGFHIIGAKNQSSMNFTAFHDLNTLHFEGWNLTGAVTFYESNVDINNSSFLNNICEDGLNVIRSTFTMNNSTINHTAFDGLDADFCTATITNSQFLDIGNDGVDVSGAEITVDNCQFKNIGDKGISVGEQSTLKATNISVIEASIGLASKDLSVLTGNNIVIENADTAFAAYEKKGEFGSATINLTNTKATNFNLKIKEDKPNSISVQ